MYFIGMFIAACISALYMWASAREKGVLVLQDIIIVILLSLFSWVVVLIAVICLVIYVIAECPNIVIWKRKEE